LRLLTTDVSLFFSAEADTAEEQQDLPTASSEDMMKLGLMENNSYSAG